MAGNSNTPSFMSKSQFRKTWNKNCFQSKSVIQSPNYFPFDDLVQAAQQSLSNKTLMFHAEGALSKSSTLFPYFMLVAFEAGGLLRALVLILLYPIVYLVGKELGMRITVFVCFVGIKRESFRIGRTVLPKFFLEDVGFEGFDVVMRACNGRKIGVSDLPRVMVDGFLRDYLGVQAVVGRELKVFCGYFLGLMEENKADSLVLDNEVIGITSFNMSLDDQQLFSHCKVVYLVSEAEKTKWQVLARENYPRPLIFHDGRLAFKPTPLSSLAMSIWFPFGLYLCIIRLIIVTLLPYQISVPILSSIGMRLTPNYNCSSTTKEKYSEGVLYVCNHRTLIDPIYLSIAIMKPLTAVTYSLSRFSELLSPIKTVRLTRDRERDSKMLEKQLSKGDLVVCPEGTTCREPYLLRFSPLFAEMTDHIVPVAIDYQVQMFYGTTATGFKWLDPIFLLMNPIPACYLKILDKLPRSITCGSGGKSKFEVANHIQARIAEAFNFKCTRLSRKDKYLILAGNEGRV